MLNEYIEKSRLLVQSGRPEEAFRCLDRVLEERPDQGAYWNEAGMILRRSGRVEEAAQYFLRSVELPDHPGEVYRNLVDAYLSMGRPDRVLPWLKKGLSEGALDEAAITQTAECFQRQADPATAMDVLCEGQTKLDTIQTVDAHIEALKNKRAKIAFFCGGDGPTFLRDIVEYTKQRYPVRYFEGQTEQDVRDLMQWSDISWFEWCTDLARIGSNFPKVCRTIVRLHRYEAHLEWPKLINWQNVDLLMTVGNDWVNKALNHWVGDIRRQTSVVTIPNGVNVDAIEYKRRKPGKKIAFVAKLRMVKNPMLLVQCMAELLKIDREYKLYMAGDRADLLLRQYLEHTTKELGISDAFVYDDFQDDIPGWLADKNFIVSTSVIESQGMGILEAMAAGIKPVVHNFPGAREIFGDGCLFNTPQEFCRRILEDSYHSKAYRQFVERRYSLERQLLRINEIFAKFESRPVTTPQSTQKDARVSHSPEALSTVV